MLINLSFWLDNKTLFLTKQEWYQWLVVVVIAYSCQLLIVCEGTSSHLRKDASTLIVKLFYVIVHAKQFLDNIF